MEATTLTSCWHLTQNIFLLPLGDSPFVKRFQMPSNKVKAENVIQ